MVYRKSSIFSESDLFHTLHLQNAVHAPGKKLILIPIFILKIFTKNTFRFSSDKTIIEEFLPKHICSLSQPWSSFSLLQPPLLKIALTGPVGILWQYWVAQLASGQWYAMVFGFTSGRGSLV